MYYPKIALKYPFELVEIDGETIAVAVEEGADDFHGVIKLQNETAKFMFEKIKEGVTLPDLMFYCIKKYGGTPDEVGPIALEFLETLRKEGILDIEPPPQEN